MRIIIILVVPPLIIVPAVFALARVPLPAPFPAAGGKARTVAAVIVLVASALVWLGALGAEIVDALRSTSPSTSLFFSDRELRSEEPWGLVGRHYRGLCTGRAVDVYVIPGRSFQRPLLTIEVQANPVVLFSAGLQAPLAAGGTGERFKIQNRELTGGLWISPEPDRARLFLEKSTQARAALIELLSEPKRFGNREVAVLPDRIRLRARVEAGMPVRRWIGLATELASIVEGKGD